MFSHFEELWVNLDVSYDFELGEVVLMIDGIDVLPY